MIPAPTTLRVVRDLEPADFTGRLAGAGLVVRMGPFDVSLRARCAALDGCLQSLYADYPLIESDAPRSFHVAVEDRTQWWPQPRSMVRFLIDGRKPHADMPREQALAVLEWGINLVVALRYHCFLMLHAAVVERNGRALVLPAAPGSGKTTLCAALVHRGWRLLSDEFGLVRPADHRLIPLPRLMPVKNESIEVLGRFAAEARWGPVIENTRKGTIRHLIPPAESVRDAGLSVPAAWVVFPRWRRDARLSLEPMPPADAFMQIAANAFNYELLGQQAFETVRSIVQSSNCHSLEYNRLDDAIAALDRLADDAG